jgi:hypothetical protein
MMATTSNPRHVQLTIRRSGYNQGSVVVNMTVVYTGPGDTEGMSTREQGENRIIMRGNNHQVMMATIKC